MYSKTLNSPIYKALPALLIVFALLLYFPSLFTPFWGDDYVFLQQARSSRLSADSWWLPFYSQSQLGFWRPLSMDTYFRWIETYLASDVFYTHIVNFILWIFASASVGFFTWAFAGAMKWNQRVWLGFLAAGMYGINGAHFLPVHWIAAVNSSILVVWTALALSFWVLAPQLKIRGRLSLCILLPVVQIFALLSKESSILIPFLLLTLAGCCWRQLNFSYLEVCSWLVCALVCAVWFYFYRQFSGQHPDVYGLKIGVNILRNVASLVAWLLNVPREALRLILTGRELEGIVWAGSVAVPMLGFIYLCLAKYKLLFIQSMAIVVFIGFAYAPYFLLASQSYEYYAAVALIFPVAFLAHGLMLSEKKLLAVILLCTSSVLSIQLSRMVDYPSLLGRAVWGEQQIEQLERRAVIPNPLVVKIHNHHRFYAIGVAGLSWRLGVPLENIHLTDQCAANVKEMLEEDTAGNLFWRDCDSVHNRSQ